MKQRVSKLAGWQVGESARARTKHFRDLLLWKAAMRLALDVYKQTAGLPKSEVFGLQSQMRRAAISVPGNIAEGHGRLSDPGFRVILGHARGSLFELETQMGLCRDLKFVEATVAASLLSLCGEVARMINGLLKTIRRDKVRRSSADPPSS